MPLCCAILFRSIAPLLHCFLPVPALRVQLCVPDVLQEGFPDACSRCVLQVCAPDLRTSQMYVTGCVPDVLSKCVFQMFAADECVPDVCSRCVFQMGVLDVCSKSLTQICVANMLFRCSFADTVCLPGVTLLFVFDMGASERHPICMVPNFLYRWKSEMLPPYVLQRCTQMYPNVYPHCVFIRECSDANPPNHVLDVCLECVPDLHPNSCLDVCRVWAAGVYRKM